MTIQFQDFEQELLSTTREGIQLSKEYLKVRKEHSGHYNILISLMNRAGLNKSKKGIDNKILELLANDKYGREAMQEHKEMLEAEATYKGLEVVCKAYSTHASGLQSVIKTQISGEISENTKRKYGGQ